ncbi:hypothetical protein CLAVI_000578 [Candidatus Clavichlamydia salmonicola]|uniref:hypothetical protein n=1 Tax=Candidatus Clavichlamydia salmonicola TaxID=469812 RepID=UPI0018916A6D|nr:hypothetical protein [Candidatus Clavichlamydia salmonicola]MBF5050955.1 hypothetical protein [Candidatus Clavichlamydia salmonicola]
MPSCNCCVQSHTRLNAWLFPERLITQRIQRNFDQANSTLSRVALITLNVSLTFIFGLVKPITAIIAATAGAIVLPIMAIHNHSKGMHYNAASKWMTWVLCFSILGATAGLIFVSAMFISPSHVIIMLGLAWATAIVATGVHLHNFRHEKALNQLPEKNFSPIPVANLIDL